MTVNNLKFDTIDELRAYARWRRSHGGFSADELLGLIREGARLMRAAGLPAPTCISEMLGTPRPGRQRRRARQSIN